MYQAMVDQDQLALLAHLALQGPPQHPRDMAQVQPSSCEVLHVVAEVKQSRHEFGTKRLDVSDLAALTIAGPPGPPGPPGPSGNSAAVSETSSSPDYTPRNMKPGAGRFVAPGFFLSAFQLKTFATRETMMQHTHRDAEGTLAYVTTTGSLFLKVSQGWKEIQVPSHLQILQICVSKRPGLP